MAQRLEEKGFPNVHVLEGGYDAWKSSGYPAEAKALGPGKASLH